jgi:hypothetical protein
MAMAGLRQRIESPRRRLQTRLKTQLAKATAKAEEEELAAEEAADWLAAAKLAG